LLSQNVPPWEDLHEVSLEELRLTNLVTSDRGANGVSVIAKESFHNSSLRELSSGRRLASAVWATTSLTLADTTTSMKTQRARLCSKADRARCGTPRCAVAAKRRGGTRNRSPAGATNCGAPADSTLAHDVVGQGWCNRLRSTTSLIAHRSEPPSDRHAGISRSPHQPNLRRLNQSLAWVVYERLRLETHFSHRWADDCVTCTGNE
jgi:uncharacterized low-complexity protein